jgi:mannose-6-phosphate isomerase-like protein (cupin superfamily)
MSSVKAFIDSGHLELYSLGLANAGEAAEIDTLKLTNPEISRELHEIELALEQLAQSQAITPAPGIKQRVLAALNFAAEPLDLNHLPPTNKYSDHESWYAAVEHLIPAEPFEDFFMEVLQHNEQIAQMLVVTKLDVPEEVHEAVAESFFILKGQCACTVGTEVFTLNAGDHLDIPLHINHDIKILSPYVIAILQHQFA